ncbi:MAG TPA: isochorismatase family protein [Bradyrhizobium sp.]
MPISVLDPKTALLVVDLQKGIVGLPTVHPIDSVVRNSVALLDSFRARKLPVVLINVDGVPPGRAEQSRAPRDFPAGWADLIPELNRQPTDHVVTKRTRGAFTNTDLEKYLRDNSVTQVVITGVATGAGVESTARHAHELGFNVALAIDAMTDMDADIHHNSVTRIFPKMAETGTTQQVLDLLHATPHGDKRSA